MQTKEPTKTLAAKQLVIEFTGFLPEPPKGNGVRIVIKLPNYVPTSNGAEPPIFYIWRKVPECLTTRKVLEEHLGTKKFDLPIRAYKITVKARQRIKFALFNVLDLLPANYPEEEKMFSLLFNSKKENVLLGRELLRGINPNFKQLSFNPFR